VLAERAAAVERHLARVAERLPKEPSDLKPVTDASDAVVVHLWQAQIVIDLALSACLHFNLGTPSGYSPRRVRGTCGRSGFPEDTARSAAI